MEQKRKTLTFFLKTFAFWTACILCAGVLLYQGMVRVLSPDPWTLGRFIGYLMALMLPVAAILSAQKTETFWRRQKGLSPRVGLWDILSVLCCILLLSFLCLVCVLNLRRGVPFRYISGLLIVIAVSFYRLIQDIKELRQRKAEKTGGIAE